MPTPQATPTPLLGTRNQVRSQSIALHVTTNGEEIIVFLYWKRLEAALIEVTAPCVLEMGVPALGVGQRKPTNEPRKFPRFVWFDDHVPVIGHEAPSQKDGSESLDGFFQNPFKGFVVLVFFEDGNAGISAI